MQPERRAVIDVGTNSIKLLVAEVDGAKVHPVLEESHQTRLGQGFYSSHELHPARIAQTAETVAHFAARAREQQAGSMRVIATSAAREATNSDQLISAIKQASGLKTEVISGDEEAELAFRGVRTDPQFAGKPLLQLEVGGGSTQFVLGYDHTAAYLQSFRIGSVRLLEKLPHSDPPKPAELAACRRWLDDFLVSEVRPKLLPKLDLGSKRSDCGDINLVATGGTASMLGCMEAKLDHFDRSALEAVRLTLERIQWHVQHLWGLTLEQRKQIVGLPKNRADVILTGAAIFEAVMKQFGFRELRISTRGLRFGAVLPAK